MAVGVWWRRRQSGLTVANTGDVRGGRAVVAVTGLVYGSVTVGATRYVIEDAPLRREPLPADAAGAPSRLLAARYQVATFTGRDNEVAALQRWRDDRAHQRAVRLLHGSGGQGKTRLAAEFGRLSAVSGWHVVHARHDATGSPPTTPTTPGGVAPRASGLLVIIDYAERWPVRHLLAVLDDPLLQRDGLVRVLLVARPAGSWWHGLRHELTKRGADVGTLALDPLLGDQQRAEQFTTAVADFATVLGVPDPRAVRAPDLTGDGWQLVLTVHMAALAGVDALNRGVPAPTSPERLSAYLLDREHAYWQALHETGRVATKPVLMGRAAYTATITRPLPRHLAVGVLGRVGVDPAGQSVDDHGVCYPPSDPNTALEPLYPDRLGEDFLALTTPGHTVGAYSPDPWAATAATQLLAPATPDRPAPWTAAAVNVLIETGRRWPHIAAQQLYPLLRHHPELADAAGDVYRQLPRRQESGLGVPDKELAAALNALATDLTNLGRNEEALAALTEASDIYRHLTADDLTGYGPDLVVTLTALAADLFTMNRPAEAVAATEEAADIRRQLAAADFTTFGPDLAVALTALAVKQAAPTDQAATLTEAIRTYRRLAGTQPDVYEAALARALWSLGKLHAGPQPPLGGDAEPTYALTVVHEAVGRLRHLVRRDPTTLLPDLLGAQATLADLLERLGHDGEAERLRKHLNDPTDKFDPDRPGGPPRRRGSLVLRG